MQLIRQILVRTLVLGATAVTLSACGQSGALYLPTSPAAANRATLPQSLLPDDTLARPAAKASAPR
ncbi:MAG: lipoprotein [Rhodoferax sp.]|nr:lipoprotein [Rhodoferax sp.]NCP55377.1 lipoprotein [Rhodoferax sp.]OIP23449.1 MAG: hypothetical protein AUK52_04435 [Comamonadaceae bacterium CG2_30_60_41]PIW08993.1 MAG: hypothetical protein COW39_07430 [Comamonadaceae bacterium CG17_big_fil_post_rev_8_21_14_2_50_60_13]PJC19576.1 MAG: hypothetical protein CO066_00385 [Comamonadaceae bacterium CG_4_9_14_0_8_um_filter_60_18]